jgi:hypothetical protein
MNNSLDEMKKFKRWMRRYWAGVPVVWLKPEEEFQGQVQIAWEVWIFRGLSDKAAAAVDAASQAE